MWGDALGKEQTGSRGRLVLRSLLSKGLPEALVPAGERRQGQLATSTCWTRVEVHKGSPCQVKVQTNFNCHRTAPQASPLPSKANQTSNNSTDAKKPVFLANGYITEIETCTHQMLAGGMLENCHCCLIVSVFHCVIPSTHPWIKTKNFFMGKLYFKSLTCHSAFMGILQKFKLQPRPALSN